jgi:Icc-related predicted phosphoesterase
VHWKKPVLFVAGNHEYYRSKPMKEAATQFGRWLAENHPNVTFLQDEAITLDGVHFFGGTMWTDFAQASDRAMWEAHKGMNDYRLITVGGNKALTPQYTVKMHAAFVKKIRRWFDQELTKPRVVITHHAPVVKPNSRYSNSTLLPAFNSLDMLELIEAHQPDLWVYGHTHEGDDHFNGKTRIISNQLGYPNRQGGLECTEFDPDGLPVDITSS